jgi:serine O-acetyltransferase
LRLLLAPFLIAYGLTDQRRIIDADVRRWAEVLDRDLELLMLLRLPEFRSLFYYRLSRGNLAGRLVGRLFRVVIRGQSALFLATPVIGPGLFLQHGFSTIVTAESIGANCWINQQVTIGFNDRLELPVLEDDVEVYAGAKIIGGVRIGRGARIGANAVVVKDVPAGSVAVGVPAVARPRQRPSR